MRKLQMIRQHSSSDIWIDDMKMQRQKLDLQPMTDAKVPRDARETLPGIEFSTHSYITSNKAIKA
jgi:hypothetical protein